MKLIQIEKITNSIKDGSVEIVISNFDIHIKVIYNKLNELRKNNNNNLL